MTTKQNNVEDNPMSTNSIAFPGNTICYLDKPAPSRAESEKIESNQKSLSSTTISADKKISADANLLAAQKTATPTDAIQRVDERNKLVEPSASVNASGQLIGTLINVTA